MVEEEWRNIVVEKNGVVYDYTGLYQVSNLGRVKRLGNNKNAHEKILKPGTLWKGHQQVSLCKDGKVVQFKVHRLVAAIFIQNPENLPVVNHKDENPLNNCVDNLEWCTQQHNVKHSYNLHKDERHQYCVNGGKSRKGEKRAPFSQEHKDNISKAKKGKHLTEEHRHKLSVARAARENKQEDKREDDIL